MCGQDGSWTRRNYYLRTRSHQSTCSHGPAIARGRSQCTCTLGSQTSLPFYQAGDRLMKAAEEEDLEDPCDLKSCSVTQLLGSCLILNDVDFGMPDLILQ